MNCSVRVVDVVLVLAVPVFLLLLIVTTPSYLFTAILRAERVRSVDPTSRRQLVAAVR